MYESPITLISGAFHLNLEDGVYKAVRQTGVVVDKDELIKALKYDRGQYEKGYADAKAERKTGRWIDARDHCGEFLCSNCHETNINNSYKYCPYCGAEMEAVDA